MNDITPDLTVFIRIPVNTALERCHQRGALSAYEKEEFLQKVAAGLKNCIPTTVLQRDWKQCIPIYSLQLDV